MSFGGGVMEIRIRRCGPGDAAALALVGQATFLETYPDILPVADLVHHCTHQHAASVYAAWLEDPSAAVWIAEAAETGAPVGYAVLCRPDLPTAVGAADLELRRIYLLSRFHGGGLGEGLMAAALQAAREQGAPRVWLGVYDGNARAIAFYGRHGFAPAGRREFRVGARTYDDLVLARDL